MRAESTTVPYRQRIHSDTNIRFEKMSGTKFDIKVTDLEESREQGVTMDDGAQSHHDLCSPTKCDSIFQNDK